MCLKLVVLAYASEKSETLVSEGHRLHDDKITYYDASVLLSLWAQGPQRNTSLCFWQNFLPSVLTAIGPGGSRRAWRLKLWVAS